MDAPIQYARSGDVNIAYQVTGGGPFDLVVVSGFVSHLDNDWDHPGSARMLERLGGFARLIRFDKRGTGLSDRAIGLPDFETRMDDVRAVMDAAGSERAAVFGYSEGRAAFRPVRRDVPRAGQRPRALRDVREATWARRRLSVVRDGRRARCVRGRRRARMGRRCRYEPHGAERRRAAQTLVPGAGTRRRKPRLRA